MNLRSLLRGRTPRVPFIQQGTATDCGAASLAMVLAFHGRFVYPGALRGELGIGRDGSSALAL
ncbi:MAG: hypothetical protein KC636_03675, partial [Myxococcales bacterium]|nr:hypothetical protein [Myxococcales bacterium]